MTAPTLDPALDFAQWVSEVHALAEQRDAVILAHNYQVPEIQDVAHHVGDSLALSRIAATAPQSTIVFCGVHFMAETAKILSPDKTVLIPDAAAGCSLADSLTADQLRGAHVRRVLGRDNISVWGGECHVHAGINGGQLTAQAAANPDADLYIHPECGCATSALYLASAGAVPADRVKILSTGEMVDAARLSTSRKVLVATEIGMIHQLRKAAPGVDFRAVNERASCRYMKMITPEKLLVSLRELRDEVVVDPEIAAKARGAVERMISIGQSGSGE